MPNEIFWFKGNASDNTLTADFVAGEVCIARDWDGSAYSNVWMVQTDEADASHPNGYWTRMFESDPRFARYQERGAQMFPKEGLVLCFIGADDTEYRWDVTSKWGYVHKGATHVKSIDRAFAKAAARPEDYYTQNRRMDKAAAALGVDLGGCNLTIKTPPYSLMGDSETIWNKLIEDGYVPPMSDDEKRSKRPYRPYLITNNGQGIHTFQGVSSNVPAPDQGAAGKSNTDRGTYQERLDKTFARFDELDRKPASFEQQDIPF